MRRKRTRPCFVGVRLTPDEKTTVLECSQRTDQPGNISAGIRWIIDHAQAPGNDARKGRKEER